MSDPKYYRDWDAKPEYELPRDQAEKLVTYCRGWHRPDGSLQRLELIDDGRLVRVDYFDARDAEVAHVHRAQYPDALRMVHQDRGGTAGFQWSSWVGTAPDGTITVRGLGLRDSAGQDLMSIEYDERGLPIEVRKYWRDESGELRYVFQYDQDGSLFSIFDRKYGDSASFEDLKPQLTDVAFFEEGFALPPAIAGTAIPDVVLPGG